MTMASTVLMTQTLPTVIGMAVVSKTISETLGKQATKRVAGKRYVAVSWFTNKSTATKEARAIRKKGHPARVSRAYNRKLKMWGYAVYIR